MRSKKSLSFIFLSTFLYLFPASLFAAHFFIVKDTTTKTIGDNIHATLYVDTDGVSINDGEATITFPKEITQVQSLSTSGSIFSLWVEQPTFSNGNGSITFNGGVPNPGFIGSRGKVLDIIFKATDSGSGPFLVSSANILADDGLGTDVASQSPATTIVVQEKNEPLTPSEGETITQQKGSNPGLPTPRITSKEIADPTVWYSLKSATFSWALPSGVSTVLTSLDTTPNGIPTKEYTPAISSKKIKDLSDGKQYLHVRFVGATGRSDVATYPFKIDTLPPQTISITQNSTSLDGVTLTLSTHDNESGLASYVIYIDGKQSIKITEGLDSAVTYMLPVLPSGDHTINIHAFDGAGNETDKTIEVTTKLLPPRITEYPHSITSGDSITLAGISPYAYSRIRIWVKEDNGEAKSYTVTTDAQGLFTYTLSPVRSKKYTDAYAEVIVSQGEKSAPSNGIHVSVNKSTASLVTVGLLSTLILALLYILYIKIQLWKLRLEKNLDLTSIDINTELDFISKEIKDYIKVLRLATRKQTMSHAEEMQLRSLFKQLTKSHSTLIKKISKGTRI